MTKKIRELELKFKKPILDSVLIGASTYFITGAIKNTIDNFLTGNLNLKDILTNEWGIYLGLGAVILNFTHEIGHQIYDDYRGIKKYY